MSHLYKGVYGIGMSQVMYPWPIMVAEMWYSAHVEYLPEVLINDSLPQYGTMLRKSTDSLVARGKVNGYAPEKATSRFLFWRVNGDAPE